ncbi:MAG: MFS transporter, partial [Myxococcota bacterium]
MTTSPSEIVAPPRPLRRRLGPNVLALGVVSLCTDASSEMILPLLPLFLTTTLGGGAMALGVIEGSANTVASLVKLYAGRLTDRTGRRKTM